MFILGCKQEEEKQIKGVWVGFCLRFKELFKKFFLVNFIDISWLELSGKVILVVTEVVKCSFQLFFLSFYLIR